MKDLEQDNKSLKRKLDSSTADLEITRSQLSHVSQLFIDFKELVSQTIEWIEKQFKLDLDSVKNYLSLETNQQGREKEINKDAFIR